MKKIEAEWEEYRRSVIAANAPAVQITECRRSFYSGVWALWALIMNNLEPGAEETPKDLALMENLDAEMREFAADVQRGVK